MQYSGYGVVVSVAFNAPTSCLCPAHRENVLDAINRDKTKASTLPRAPANRCPRMPDPPSPKVFKYMDLRLLAEVAEDAGVDFRVLYLRRKARDIILADTVHRQFHK